MLIRLQDHELAVHLRDGTDIAATGVADLGAHRHARPGGGLLGGGLLSGGLLGRGGLQAGRGGGERDWNSGTEKASYKRASLPHIMGGLAAGFPVFSQAIRLE